MDRIDKISGIIVIICLIIVICCIIFVVVHASKEADKDCQSFGYKKASNGYCIDGNRVAKYLFVYDDWMSPGRMVLVDSSQSKEMKQ